MTDLESAIRAAVAAYPFGRATAAKWGRDPRWPYVPILDRGTHTSQLLGRAFATRNEAIAYATENIEHLRRLARDLADQGHRALRESLGLPREIVRSDFCGNNCFQLSSCR